MKKKIHKERAFTMKQDTSKPAVYIFDIDGTLALMGDRSPFEWSKVGEDDVFTSILNIQSILGDRYGIILLSGRDSVCRPETEQWLKDNHIYYNHLWMRPEGDQRNDAVIKKELFEENIKGKFYVKAVFDDRDRVVKMWRDIGLVCLQVAPGDF